MQTARDGDGSIEAAGEAARPALPPATADNGGRRGSAVAGAAMLAGAGLAALAVYNRLHTIAAEGANPPRGRIVDVGGVGIHVAEAGDPDGSPVVLLHGNIVTLEDWFASGVVDRLAGHRVILFDRPGYGFSDRPGTREWTVAEQAALLRAACSVIGVRRPVVVGHSLGSMVALRWGLDAPESVAGLVLAAGYYFPTMRPDALLVAPAALPVLGPLLRHTVSPPFTRAALPAALRVMFAPREVPERFEAEFPVALVSRPGQIRAIATDGSRIVTDARGLAARLPGFAVPTVVLAGDRDQIVSSDEQSGRLAAEVGAVLDLVEGAGHAVHHAAPERVAAAVERLAGGDGAEGRARPS